jgi:hypothetical protein
MASPSKQRARLAPALGLVSLALGGCYQHSPHSLKRECIPANALEEELPEDRLGEVARFAELGRPFDADRRDTVGPDDRFAIFGKSPEIVALPDGDAIDVLVQSYADDGAEALVLRLSPVGDDYAITRVLEPPVLDRIVGFARDEDGALYVASGVDEALRDPVEDRDAEPKSQRVSVLRLVKMSADGEVVFDVDLDQARRAADEGAAPVLGLGLGSSARLAYGGGRLVLMHDVLASAGAGGSVARRSAATRLDAATGAVLEASTMDGESIDARLVYGPDGFVEVHLGDEDQRGVALRSSEPDAATYPLLYAKGDADRESPYARLGGIAPIEGDRAFGYLALVATERTSGLAPIHEGERYVAGSRDLAIVRIRRDFTAGDPTSGAYVDAALPDAFVVTSGAEARTNRVRFLTQYEATSGGAVQAERPKLVALGGDRFMVLWERWEHDPSAGYVFTGTWGVVVDGEGAALAAPTALTEHHLPRGDEAFRLGDGAAFLTGDAPSASLRLHRIGADLRHTEIVIE